MTVKTKYRVVEQGHYRSEDGRMVITKDYAGMWTVKVDGALLGYMPVKIAYAKAQAEKYAQQHPKLGRQ
jgi:hypothetical protein